MISATPFSVAARRRASRHAHVAGAAVPGDEGVNNMPMVSASGTAVTIKRG